MSSQKVYVITGASRGIGLELVRQLAERKDTLVFAAARNPDKSADLKKLEADSEGRVVLVTLDVDDEKSIAGAVKHVSEKTKKVDVLINNAGISAGPEERKTPTEPVLEVTKKNLLSVFQTNVVGLVLVTQAFFPLVAAAKKETKDMTTTDVPKVINLSTAMGSITRNNGTMNAYRASKAAVNILTSSAAIENPEIAFIPLHPGWVDTDMGSAAGKVRGVTPPVKVVDSVKGLLSVIDKVNLEASGKFLSFDGTSLPW